MIINLVIDYEWKIQPCHITAIFFWHPRKTPLFFSCLRHRNSVYNYQYLRFFLIYWHTAIFPKHYALSSLDDDVTLIIDQLFHVRVWPRRWCSLLVQYHCSYHYHWWGKINCLNHTKISVISQRVVRALHYITNWVALFWQDGAVYETFCLSSQLHLQLSVHSHERIAIVYLGITRFSSWYKESYCRRKIW